MKITTLLILLLSYQTAVAGPSTLDVKKRGEQDIRKVVEPVISQYCHEQCQIIHIDTEVDLAVDDLTTPGFESSSGRATLAPASGKVRLLMDESLGSQTRIKITDLLKEHLEILDFPVDIETHVTKFPQPAASNYRVADLKDKVTREIKASMQNMLTQFCPDSCLLGEFDVQTEVINPEDVNYAASQDFFQDGPAAIRVRGVNATIMTDQGMSSEQTNGIVQMAKLKVAQYKNSTITNESMVFPKLMPKDGLVYGKNGALGVYGYGDAKELKDLKETHDAKEARELREAKDSRESKTENSTSKNTQNSADTTNNQVNDSKQEKFEHYEKIERVENGDAVQQVLEKFKLYGIVFGAIVLALLMTLVAVSFRKQIFESHTGEPNKDASHKAHHHSLENGANLTGEEKASLISRRIEADNLFQDLTRIFSEQPKIARHVFTHILTEEGVETTAQYLEIFGESVVMDLLRDPGLQSDLTELMDFYARNTFDINDEEKMQLLKRLHHRTVTAKMQVHGSRSAALFDFLAEMDTPQIIEMVKNESNTVKAIILTQCDSKKRQGLFNAHDDATRLKLMTELSRIDHLPKNYIYNVAQALRRKKIENPKLNTEALPGTDVLVSFLEKADIATQRTIVHQLMGTAGGEALQNLKSKLISIETLRFIRDQQLIEVITHVKHEELVQFLKACSVEVRESILNKAPAEMAADLKDGINLSENVSKETYLSVERKLLNRMKVLANNGQFNIAAINERIFTEEFGFQNQASEIASVDMRRVG
jgi:flagellar motor switch protein FliG